MGAAAAAERYKSLPPQRMTLLADGYRQKESTLKRWMMMGTKILVIDDDVNICDMLKLYLENDG